jgi:lysophospholipid acyltransferase (LPLAT)-like uncharacterized protein
MGAQRKQNGDAMKRIFRLFLYRYCIPYMGLLVVKLISATYRMRLVDIENETGAIDKTGGVIYASWHQRFFPGITFFATRKPITIMISQSKDGEFMARIVDILGWLPVRGSSSRGGSEGLKRLKDLAFTGYKVGHIVDGPKGPFGVVKPGLITIAGYTGLPIIPTITSSQNRWVFRSWDRFMVPKPFSRVIIRFGDPIYIPTDLDDETFEQKRIMVEERLKELYEDTDLIWSNPERMNAIFAKG